MNYLELQNDLNMIELTEFGSDEREFKVEQSDTNTFIIFTQNEISKDQVAIITPMNLNVDDDFLKVSQQEIIFEFYKELKGRDTV